MKALCFVHGYDVIKTHSLVQIIKSLQMNGELENIAKELDLYYISGRYPDAFPAGAPFEMFTREQAESALAKARRIFTLIGERIDVAVDHQ